MDGVDKQLYVQYPENWSEAEVIGDTEVRFDYNNRMYLSNSPTIDTNDYFKPNLFGGSIEFDIHSHSD